MKALYVIIVAAVAFLAGGIGGFLLEREHSAKTARTMEASYVSERLGIEMLTLHIFRHGETNRAIDYLEAHLESSALDMCGVLDENPPAKDAIGYRNWLLSVADYRVKYPRLQAVGSDWDRKVTSALAKALGPEMPPNTALEPTPTGR